MKSDMIEILKGYYQKMTKGSLENVPTGLKSLELIKEINVDEFKCLSTVPRIEKFINNFINVDLDNEDLELYFARTLARYYTIDNNISEPNPKNCYDINYNSKFNKFYVSDITNGVPTTLYENFRNTVKPFKDNDTHTNFLHQWNIMTNKRVLITHGSKCNDGLGVISVVAKYCNERNLPLNKVLSLDHKNVDFDMVITESIDSVVYIGDFSFSKEQMKTLKEVAKMVVVVDHHDSAMKELIEEENAFIDKAHSGAVLAHLFFNIGEPIPLILELIEDRDLYTFLYGDITNAVMHAILDCGFQYILNYLWDTHDVSLQVRKDCSTYYVKDMIRYEPRKILTGYANDFLHIVEKERIKNENDAKAAIPYLFADNCVFGLNYTSSPSDVLNIASRENKCGAFSYKFITIHYENSEHVKKSFDAIDFSFRSYSDKIPINGFCELLGGGGHPQSAGACINIKSLMLKSFFNRHLLVKYKMSDRDRATMHKLLSMVRGQKEVKGITLSNNLYTNNDVLEIANNFDINVKDMFVISKDNINILHLKIKPSTERTKEILSNFGY